MFEPHRISFFSFETWKQRTHPKLTLPHAHTYVHIYVVLQNVYFRVSDFIIITYSCTYTTYTSLMTCTYESLSLSPSFYIPSNIEVVCVHFGFAIRFNELFQRSGKQTRNIISLVSWEIILAHWTHLVISSQFFWKGNTYVRSTCNTDVVTFWYTHFKPEHFCAHVSLIFRFRRLKARSLILETFLGGGI